MWRHRNNQMGIAQMLQIGQMQIVEYLFIKTDAGIAVSWNVVQWPANSSISLSAALVFILLFPQQFFS